MIPALTLVGISAILSVVIWLWIAGFDWFDNLYWRWKYERVKKSLTYRKGRRK